MYGSAEVTGVRNLVLLLFGAHAGYCLLHCGRGQFLMVDTTSSELCLPCRPGSFREESHHREPACEECTVLDDFDAYKEVVAPCTAEQDTQFRCIQPGFFYNSDYHECFTCENCEPDNAMKEPSSQEDDELLMCTKGQFLQRGINGNKDACLPCGPGLFREETSHRESDCVLCSSIAIELDSYIELVAPCVSEHDTRIRCGQEKFYFSRTYQGCFPCTFCESYGLYEAAPCSDYADAVCCSEPSMVVQDGRCKAAVSCGQGEFLVSGRDGADQCLQCPANTTNYEGRHRLTECRHSCISSPAECMKRVEDDLGDTTGRMVKDETMGIEEYEEMQEKWSEREGGCTAGECELGRSCERSELVICTHCQQETRAERYKVVDDGAESNTSQGMRKFPTDDSSALTLFYIEVIMFVFIVLASITFTYVINSHIRHWQRKRNNRSRHQLHKCANEL